MENSFFSACYTFDEADRLKKQNLYPYFRPIESSQDTEVFIDGKKYLMMGSNAYLGLVTDAQTKKAAINAIEKYGTGNAGSRFLNGNLDVHEKLEKRLAKFTNKEDALLFSAGYLVNLGAISILAGRHSVLITDKYDHASILDGCMMSKAEMERFKHNDMVHLEKVLKKHAKQAKMIVVDGIFSMEGDIADLPGIVKLAKKYDAAVMVDDAHSIGVLGENGRGTADYFGLTDKVDLIAGTFSKSFATQGGFIAGDRKVIDFIRHFSRAEIFTASLPAANVATENTALDIMLNEPERIKHLWDITNYMLEHFKKIGYKTGLAKTPIIPLQIGTRETTLTMWRRLTDEGLFVNPVVPPAVPPNGSLIRVSFMATHTFEQMDYALEIFARVGKELGVI